MTPDSVPLGPPHNFAELIARERSALLDVLRSLEASDWSLPTPCPGWTVHDLAIHILGTDIGVLARHRDHHDATPGPDSASEVAFETFLDDLNGRWVDAGRRMSPQIVIALLRDMGEQLVDHYRHVDPSVYDAYVGWAAHQPLPRWFDHAREFTERWVHHQQLLEAIGASPWTDAEMTGVVLDTFMWAYPFRLAHLTRPAGVTAGVDIRGPVDRSWRWESTGSAWKASDGDAKTVLTMTTAQAWRLLTNGLEPKHWPEVSPSADTAIARTLARTRAILGSPNG
jgi:uncharacterized protein (TIGR03083 family)